jgi:hypothetical protein
MKRIRTISFLAVLAILLLSLPASAFSMRYSYLPYIANQTAETDLALQNPGFEGGFREVDGIAELKVSTGWQPWWDENARRPEFKLATLSVDSRRVHSGNNAQQWFTVYDMHTAGIYQRVSGVPVGKTLVFEAWVQAFSSGTDNFDQSNGRYRMRIGIDPYGGVDPESTDIVWSDGGNAIQPYDRYVFLEVETPARSDRVTVFVWGQAEWALKHNDAYCDDARLYVVDDDGGTPVPGGVTEERVREIVREEIAAAVRAWADALEAQAR